MSLFRHERTAPCTKRDRIVTQLLKGKYRDPNGRIHERLLPRHRAVPATRESLRADRAEREADALALGLTIVIPAYNEENGIREILESIKRQTIPVEYVIVVDDGSTDRTAEIAAEYDVEVHSIPNTGSKARAQNYALPFVQTELVLTVDGDVRLAPDFCEIMKKVFADNQIVIAAGNVQVMDVFSRGWHSSIIERGRQIEYLCGFHYTRPIQNMAHAPQVCSGCCSMFRTKNLIEIGGFPAGTVAEDMDYSWRMMLLGYKAVYVADAEVYVVDPKTSRQLRTQLWRWMSGYFQNVRNHWKEIIRHKKMLAVWAVLACADALVVPLWYATPVYLLFLHGFLQVKTYLALWLIVETVFTVPPILYGAWVRGYDPFRVLMNFPCVYVNRGFNSYYVLKAMVTEFLLVPLGKAKSLDTFEKGHD
jgi:cellulose synthase/poly-beta-1,6-N-acetylglucosamine synthase-like glycosyltransferase